MISLCEQGSGEWLKLRLGRVTASRVKDIMGTKAKREGYFWELVSERLTGQAEEHYVTKAMQWGIDNEPSARAAYELEYGEVERVGFVYEGWQGCSPDFLSGLEGGGEIKCPNSTTFLKWINAGVVPDEHIDQILHSLIITEREWWDFVAFDPRMPEHMQLWVIPVRANDYEDRIEDIRNAVDKFLDEVDAKVQELMGHPDV